MRLHIEASYCTFGLGAVTPVTQCDLHILLLPYLVIHHVITITYTIMRTGKGNLHLLDGLCSRGFAGKNSGGTIPLLHKWLQGDRHSRFPSYISLIWSHYETMSKWSTYSDRFFLYFSIYFYVAFYIIQIHTVVQCQKLVMMQMYQDHQHQVIPL